MAKLLGLVVLVAVVLVGLFAAEVDPPGCRLFSVDEGEWVAANRGVLEDVPVFPGSTFSYESSNGWRVAKDRCFAFENSGPYDSFATSVRYDMPAGAKFADVAAHFNEELGKRGWVLPKAWSLLERHYVRGDARLTVRSAAGEMFWEFVVNHDTS